MWNESFFRLVLEMADQPKYVKGQKVKTVDNSEDLATALGSHAKKI